MDERLQKLIRQARQQDDVEINLQVVQALERAGHLRQIMHDIEHLPLFPITIHIGAWHSGDARHLSLEIQPIHFKKVVLYGPKGTSLYDVRRLPFGDTATSAYSPTPGVFSLFSLQDLQKMPFVQDNIARFVELWGSQRELYWLPLNSGEEIHKRGFDYEECLTSTLPGVLLGGPEAPPNRRGSIGSRGITRDFSDSIDIWIQDHMAEMQSANQQWSLYQIALELNSYQTAMKNFKKQEARLNERVLNWIHNRWEQ